MWIKVTILTLSVILVFAISSPAQNDGSIVEKVRIRDLNELIAYVGKTEGIDSVSYDPRRFEYFETVEVYGITYLSDGLKVKGFLLTPKKEDRYPAIIYNRGGSLNWGSLTHSRASVGLGELARLANEGYVIAASQYRGNGGGEGQEEYGGADINDVLNLIPLLGNESRADTSRLGMFGWSRGGMMSFMTLPRTKSIKAVVVGAPSTNLIRSLEHRPGLARNWSMIIPGFNSDDRIDALFQRSPVFHVDRLPDDVPILILQGGHDKGLLPDFTLRMALELNRFHIPFRFIKYEGGSHSLKEYKDEVFGEITHWFDKYLKHPAGEAMN